MINAFPPIASAHQRRSGDCCKFGRILGGTLCVRGMRGVEPIMGRFLWAAAVAGALGLALASPASAEPQVGAVGQREYLGAGGTRGTGQTRAPTSPRAAFS